MQARGPFPCADYTMQKAGDELFYNGTTMLTWSALYPVLAEGKNPAVRRINGRIAAQRMAFDRHVQNRLYRDAVMDYRQSQAEGYPFFPYEAVQEYTVTYNENCHFSFYRDQYQYTGGAHGTTTRFGNTFSLQTGREIPLSAFFAPGSAYASRLKRLITEQARQNMEKEPGLYFDNYPKLICQYFDENSYFLTPEGIALYFGQYEIGPYVIGIPVFIIPWCEVNIPPCC